MIVLVAIVLIEAYAIFGRMNPAIASVKAVIHSSIVLALAFWALLAFV